MAFGLVEKRRLDSNSQNQIILFTQREKNVCLEKLLKEL